MNRTIIQNGRTMFANEIIAEFWMPKKASGRVVVICDGAPGLRSKSELGEFLARKGYWVFQFRYRGTWESKGEFLKISPEKDIDDILLGIESGFREFWSGIIYSIELQEVVVIGASFGGPAAILSTLNPKVNKAIAIAPIVDWSKSTKEEPFSEFEREIFEGFPGAYRCPKRNLKKLLRKKFYNPVDWIDTIQGGKVFLIHAKDDTCVPSTPTKKFAKKIEAEYIELSEGGHLGSSMVMEPILWKRIEHFLYSDE